MRAQDGFNRYAGRAALITGRGFMFGLVLGYLYCSIWLIGDTLVESITLGIPFDLLTFIQAIGFGSLFGMFSAAIGMILGLGFGMVTGIAIGGLIEITRRLRLPHEAIIVGVATALLNSPACAWLLLTYFRGDYLLVNEIPWLAVPAAIIEAVAATAVVLAILKAERAKPSLDYAAVEA